MYILIKKAGFILQQLSIGILAIFWHGKSMISWKSHLSWRYARLHWVIQNSRLWIVIKEAILPIPNIRNCFSRQVPKSVWPTVGGPMTIFLLKISGEVWNMRIFIWRTTPIFRKPVKAFPNIWIIIITNGCIKSWQPDTIFTLLWQVISSFPVRSLLENNQCIKDAEHRYSGKSLTHWLTPSLVSTRKERNIMFYRTGRTYVYLLTINYIKICLDNMGHYIISQYMSIYSRIPVVWLNTDHCCRIKIIERF